VRYEFSAGFIVINNNKFLLLFSGKRVDVPKGNIKEGENSLQAAIRELYEETGLTLNDIKIIDRFKEEVTIFYRFNDDLIKKKITYFLCLTEKNEIKISDEHDNYKWATFDEAMNIIKYKGLKEVIQKAVEKLKSKQ